LGLSELFATDPNSLKSNAIFNERQSIESWEGNGQKMGGITEHAITAEHEVFGHFRVEAGVMGNRKRPSLAVEAVIAILPKEKAYTTATS
jgi:hypothetical protein